MMNRHASPSDGELFDQVRRFVCDSIIPYEKDPRVTPHGPTEDLRREQTKLSELAAMFHQRGGWR